MAAIHEAIDKLQEDAESDHIPSRLSKSDNEAARKRQQPRSLMVSPMSDEKFKLLFKYMRAWSLFVAQQKEARIQKEYFETQLMRSIHRADISRM